MGAHAPLTASIMHRSEWRLSEAALLNTCVLLYLGKGFLRLYRNTTTVVTTQGSDKIFMQSTVVVLEPMQRAVVSSK